MMSANVPTHYPGYGPQPSYPPPQRRSAIEWVPTLIAAVVSVAVWGTVVVVYGHNSGASTNLHGYHLVDDLCAATDFGPVTSKGFQQAPPSSAGGKNPQPSTFTSSAFDEMKCDMRLSAPGNTDPATPVSAWVSIDVLLHKQTDPGPEFASGYQPTTASAGTQVPRTTKVPGIGDDAYESVDSYTDLFAAQGDLVVRDGAMVISVAFSEYASSSLSKSSVPTDSDVLAVLTAIARADMTKLKG